MSLFKHPVLATVADLDAIAEAATGRPLANDDRETLAAYLESHDRHLQRYQAHGDICHDGYKPDAFHNALLGLLRKVRTNIDDAKQDVVNTAFATVGLEIDQQAMLVREAVRLLSMIDFDAPRASHARSLRWKEQESYVAFMTRVFPCDIAGAQDVTDALDEIGDMSAVRLKKCNITIKPTVNLADHLTYHDKENTLYVFLQTGFLKVLQKYVEKDMNIQDSLRKKYNLPRQLILEVLMTIHVVLFPAGNEQADEILHKLVTEHERTGNVDHQCEYRPGEVDELHKMGDFEYHYFGKRLLKLQELVRRPPPKSRLMKWIKTKTNDVNALWIAILGLFLSVFFGALGVILGIIQTVISYKQLQQGSGSSNTAQSTTQ